MASIEVKGLPNFKQMARDSVDKREKALTAYLELAVTEIDKRTRSGRDATGRDFNSYAPYNKDYRAAKEFATGRGATVDLVGFNYKKKTSRKTTRRTPRTQPGAMLAAMTSKVKRIGNAVLEGVINFRNPKEADKARGNQERRNFFNLSDTQIKKLKELMGSIKL